MTAMLRQFYELYHQLEQLPETTKRNCEAVEGSIQSQQQKSAAKKRQINEDAKAHENQIRSELKRRCQAMNSQQQALESEANTYGSRRKSGMKPSGPQLNFEPTKQTLEALKQDVTHRKRLDFELQELNKKLKLQKDHTRTIMADLITVAVIIAPIIMKAITPRLDAAMLMPATFSNRLMLVFMPLILSTAPLFVALTVYFMPNGLMKRRWQAKHGPGVRRPVGKSILWLILISIGYSMFSGLNIFYALTIWLH